MKRTVVAGILVLCLGLATAGSAAGTEAEQIVPTAAGTTVIRAEGVSGIKVNFPRDVLWKRKNITLEMSNAVDRAFVGVRSDVGPPDMCDLCFGGAFVSAAPHSALGIYVGGCETTEGTEAGCAIAAGVHEIYFASDGVLTFTMRFPELSGVVDVDSTGFVQGAVEKVPATCHAPDCSVQGGGFVRQIGLGGKASIAGVIAWVNTAVAQPANPSAVNIAACAYPGYFNSKPADPAQYPVGCDAADVGSKETLAFLLPAMAMGGLETAAEDGSARTHGGQYLGFTAHSRAPFGPTTVAAYAHWFNEGISCPTGNFFYCPQR